MCSDNLNGYPWSYLKDILIFLRITNHYIFILFYFILASPREEIYETEERFPE